MPVASLSYILDPRSWATMLLGHHYGVVERLIEDVLRIDWEPCKHRERSSG
jgi:hypothetical protein